MGGWAYDEGVAGAARAMQKCTAMGWPWIKVHPQTGLHEYLILESEFLEDFNQCWSHFVTNTTKAPPASGTTSGSASAALGDASRSAATGDQKLTKETVPTPKDGTTDGGAKGKKRKTAPAGDDDKPENEPESAKKNGKDTKKLEQAKKEKKQFNKLVADAKQLKSSVHETTSKYVHLDQTIKSDEEWSWAKDGVKHKLLKESMDNLNKQFNPWMQEFLAANDFRDITRTYSNDRIKVELEAFLEAKPSVESLTNLIGQLHRAQALFAKS